jgi:hypothetical protein
MDTVDFLNSDLPGYLTMGGSMPRLLQVCEKNYPAETKEIKYLAVPTRFWPRRKHDYIGVVWRRLVLKRYMSSLFTHFRIPQSIRRF